MTIRRIKLNLTSRLLIRAVGLPFKLKQWENVTMLPSGSSPCFISGWLRLCTEY